MRETAVEQHLIRRVKSVGGLCEKHIAPGQRDVPDRLVTWPWGVMDVVETKAPGKTPRPGQLRDHKRRLRCGVVVAVLDTKKKVDDWIVAQCAVRPMGVGLKW